MQQIEKQAHRYQKMSIATKNESMQMRIQPYFGHLAVDDNLQIVGVKDAGHVRIELVKLVNDFPAADVPQNPVVEDKIVGGVEGRSIPGVVVGNVPVHQFQRTAPCEMDETEVT